MPGDLPACYISKEAFKYAAFYSGPELTLQGMGIKKDPVSGEYLSTQQNPYGGVGFQGMYIKDVGIDFAYSAYKAFQPEVLPGPSVQQRRQAVNRNMELFAKCLVFGD